MTDIINTMIIKKKTNNYSIKIKVGIPIKFNIT